MIKDKIHNLLYFDRTKNTQRFSKIEFSLIGLYRLVSNREE